MNGNARRASAKGFTLTELLTVMGLISLLISLLMPVLSKVRAAAGTTTCLSHLRQIGTAWTMYGVENYGRLPHRMWNITSPPEAAWYGSWPGIVDRNGVRGEALLCPAAREPADDHKRGYGDVSHAWNGLHSPEWTAIRLNDQTYRVGSYGFNGYLTAGGGFGDDGRATCIGAVKDTSNVPAFLDSAFFALLPPQNVEQFPVPSLRGDAAAPGQPDHWNFLIGRHGRGVNVYMADGSARWVRLEETYKLRWKGDWQSKDLQLPSR